MRRERGLRGRNEYQMIYLLSSDIRNQLNEQVKALGERTETQVAVLAELEDFIKK